MDPVAEELAIAQREFRAGEGEAAEARVAALYERHPERADVLAARGILLAARGQSEPALVLLEQALAIAPDSVEDLAWATSCANQLGRFGDAERHARRFCEIEPGNARAHSLHAAALSGQNRIPEALAAIDRSLELLPYDADALLTKARLLRQWQLPGLAVEFYRRALAIRPSPAAAVDLAQIWLREGRPHAALEVLEPVLGQLPASLRPYDLIAQAQTHLGRFEAADANWELAEKFAVDQTALTLRRAEAEIASGMFVPASDRLGNLLETVPTSVRAFYLLGTARIWTSKDMALVARMQSLAAGGVRDPRETAELNFSLGKSFDDLADYGEAMRHFDVANRICFRLWREGTGHALDSDDIRAYTDSLIAYFTPKRIRTAAGNPIDDSRPLFVVGLPRSGTTLASQILTAHSNIGGGSEVSFWPERAIEFMARSAEGVDVRWDTATALAREYLVALPSDGPRYRYVVDKNPNNFQFAALLHAVLPKAHILHLRRHLVANALSMWMTPFRLESGYTSDRRTLVTVCREHSRLLDHFQQILPEAVFRSIRYEDLTGESESTICAMFGFLDLEVEPACLRPEANSSSVLTPSAYQVRQPIHRRSQERWKNYLPWLGELTELTEYSD